MKNITIAGVLYNGVQKIRAVSGDGTADFVDTTDTNAAAADIAIGKTAYVNGAKVTGNHACQTLASMTADANAVAGDIATGKTAYVNGAKVTGIKENIDLDNLEYVTTSISAVKMKQNNVEYTIKLGTNQTHYTLCNSDGLFSLTTGGAFYYQVGTQIYFNKFDYLKIKKISLDIVGGATNDKTNCFTVEDIGNYTIFTITSALNIATTSSKSVQINVSFFRN